jgi:hypothetical protein
MLTGNQRYRKTREQRSWSPINLSIYDIHIYLLKNYFWTNSINRKITQVLNSTNGGIVANDRRDSTTGFRIRHYGKSLITLFFHCDTRIYIERTGKYLNYRAKTFPHKISFVEKGHDLCINNHEYFLYSSFLKRSI